MIHSIVFLFSLPFCLCQVVRVAWIGNSYTFFNDLPNMFSDLSVAADPPINVIHDQNTPGGSSLFEHANMSTEMGHKTAALLDDESGWDYVVLQDQSETPGGGRNTDRGLPLGVARSRTLDALPVFYNPHISRSGAKAVFYSTWGRRDPKEEDPKNEDIYPDFLTMTTLTTQGYLMYSQAVRTIKDYSALDTIISPCGRAFELVYNETRNPLDPNSRFFNLYAAGSAGKGGHPSVNGTYLISCVFFGAIHGLSPRGISFTPPNIDPAMCNYLQDVAHRAVFDI